MDAKQAAIPWQVELLAVVLLAAGVAVWAAALRRILRRKRILPQWPRRPVPWTLPLVVAAAAITFGLRLFAVAVVQLAEATGEPPTPDRSLGPIDLASLLLADTLGSLLALPAVVGLLVLASRATPSDLGWNPRWLILDLRLGLLAFAASVVPVYGVNLLVQHLLQIDKGHPLLEALAEPQGVGFLALVFFSAVVVAPVLEELLFRVVLLGWLESAFGCFGSRGLKGQAPGSEIFPLEQQPDDFLRLPQESPEPSAAGKASRPASPRCWAAIAISAVLFGLMHWGHGAAPVALSLLGLVLGYLYQRTGRVTPCVVLHMVFNALGVAVGMTVDPSL